MKNDSFDQLSAGLRPFKPIEPFSIFFLKFLVVAFGFLALGSFLLPFRPDISSKVIAPLYIADTFLWIALTLSSIHSLYLSAFPQKPYSRLWLYPAISFSILLLLTFSKLNYNEFEGFHLEFDLYRGRCGIIILTFSSLLSLVLGIWIKKTAPRNPGEPGLWAAVTSASLGCFLMQGICLYDNSLHLLVWHFVPLFAFALIGSWVGEHIFRW